MTERNRCEWLIAAELEHELPREAAGTLAARIVAALDAAAEDAGLAQFEPGDIVQCIAGPAAGVLMVVHTAGSEGVNVYFPGPSSAISISYRPEDLRNTGGRSGFVRPASQGAQ